MYLSADVAGGMPQDIPTDFSNSLAVGGVLEHRLTLKMASTVMLKRNMHPANGLANGTRLTVRSLHRTLLDCEVVGGACAGHRVVLPRITMLPSDEQFPFQWTRRQFPVRPAFAMTARRSP